MKSSAIRGQRSVVKPRTGGIRRGGVTLTEVLMSVLLTGFGVVTLATLFPISVQRTVQATHLTHATVLRYNAEAVLDLFPTLLTDPDGAGTLATLAPNTTTGDAVVYILDPLGFHTPDLTGNVFGNGGAVNRPRFHGGTLLAANLDAARTLVTLGGGPGGAAGQSDHVEMHVEATPVTATTTSVTLPAEADLTNVPFGMTTPSQIILFSNTGRGSVTRTVAGIDLMNRIVTWTTPLPAGFVIERVRVVTPQSRYTWMMTVRSLPGDAGSQVSVVVFFNRPLSIKEEQVHTARFVQGENQLNVTWTGNNPNYRAGGFVFDIENGYWYMIQQVANETAASAMLVLDQPAFASSGSAVFMQGVVEVYPIGTK